MYPSFTPPANIPGDPAKLTPGQAMRFFEWFKAVISRRIEVLAAEVRKTPEGVKWEADFSPHSLRVLGTWLLANLSAIREEVRILPAGGQSPKIVGGTHRLTEETLARCFDVGVYLGEILIRGNPKLSWDIEKATSKRNINYGMAVIRNGKETCNPIRLAVVCANGMVMKTADSDRLRDLCEIWMGKLSH